MSFPRYESYKDSGVEWLGEVPEHWELKRLKCNLRLLTEKTDRRENPVALENIESWSGRFIQTETTFEGEGIAFDRGDILFGKLRPYLAKAYIADATGEAVGDFHVMRPTQGIDSRFSQYQILNREFIAIVDGSTFGAKMPRVNWDFLGNMVLTTPPITEQQTIAAFLDRETAKIDALIAEQQRLIELLKEKRQSVISHAVTKGLDPNAQMKDSGIEWLGEVPEHWEVCALKRICDVRDGTHDTPEFVDQSEDTYPLATSKDLIAGQVVLDDAKHISKADFDAISKRSGVSRGDVLMPMIGSIGGAVLVETEEQFAIKNIALFKKSKYFEAQWLQFILNSSFAIVQFELEKSGGVQGFVGLGTLRNLIFPVPSEHEQSAITSQLDQDTAKLDTLTAEAQRAIELLKERRTALISASVTGKIDVRTFATRVPSLHQPDMNND